MSEQSVTPSVTTPDLVRFDVTADDQASVVAALVGVLDEAGRLLDGEQVTADLMAREAAGSTAIPGGVAIPHARSAGVAERTVVLLRLASPVSWSAGSAPVDLVMGLFTPAGDSDGYLKLLASLTRGVVGRLPRDVRAAATPEEASGVLAAALR